MSTSTGKRQNWKQQQKSTNTASTATIRSPPKLIQDDRISARPPNEKITVDDSKFQMPNKEKENELTRLQIQIQDFHKEGNYAKALTLSETLVKDTVAHFSSNHPASAAAYNNLGLMKKLQGQFDEARQDYTKALDVYREILGNDHASYANTLHNLGNLNRTQIHLDTTLSATDRLSLVESALTYLEEAHRIRSAELGPVHPHTVSSRSAWGATLAAQILHHHKMTSALSQGGDLMRKRYYVSILPTNVTETAWAAAEEHLRQALTTAIDNPRGLTMAKAAANASSSDSTSHGPPQRGKRKMKAAPKMPNVSSSSSSSTTTVQSPQTLSAAAAAQNLAVFLKARATTVQPYDRNWLTEAETLYRQTLEVQSVLLPKAKADPKQKKASPPPLHPDMYATKHSLAEVLEAMGQLDEANVIRQEILDTLDPPSLPPTETTSSSSTTTTTNDDPPNVTLDDRDTTSQGFDGDLAENENGTDAQEEKRL